VVTASAPVSPEGPEAGRGADGRGDAEATSSSAQRADGHSPVDAKPVDT